MIENTRSPGFDDRLREITRQWKLYATEREARERAMKHFQFEIAADTASEKVPGGWTRDDLAKAVLKHARMYGAERTAAVLQRTAGWKVVENIKPEQYGLCIAHLCHEVTKRPFLPVSPVIFRLSQLPKAKGFDDNPQ